MKRIIHQAIIASLLVFSIFAITGCYSTAPVAGNQQYNAPEWVPVYEPGVRYYYIPDIETYYDVANHDFVYLDHGQWIYSNDLPPVYRGYDLNNGYAVALDKRVYEPWRYHQNYSSNYPKYYYRERYSNNPGNENIRGYNENARKPVYSNTPARSQRSSNTTNQYRPATRPRSSSPQTQPSQPSQPPQQTQQTQSPTVNNRNVGKPVKVTPDMRDSRQTQAPQTTNTRRGERPVTTNTNESRAEQRKTDGTSATPQQENSESRQTQTNKREEIKEKKEVNSDRRR